MDTTKTLQETIPGSLALAAARSTTTGPLPDANWSAKWLKIKSGRNEKLKELEREAGRFCFDMWRHPGEGRLLLLAGENGTGKTHVAKAIRYWVQGVGHGMTFESAPNKITFLQAIFWSWPHLLDVLKEGQWSVVEDMMETPLLIIDELGGGHDPSRVGVDKLCQILSRREFKWTLITTNIMPDAWEAAFDRRVASRFQRNSTIVDLSDVPDFNS